MATPALLLLVVTCLTAIIAGVRGGQFPARGVAEDVDDVDDGGREGDEIIEDVREVDGVGLGHSHRGRHRNRGDESGDAENDTYDNFVYSMSYQPEFCRENNERFSGCHNFMESWEGQLTIHGLWPNRNDGTWPSTCSNEHFDLSLLQDLADDMALKWPNIKSAPGSRGHTSFWEHEWSKHGTCSGLDQHAYFATALSLLISTPPIVKENYGSVVRREEVEEGYQGSGMAVLVCKNGYLSEVRVCYDKAEEGRVGIRVPCSEATLRQDSCGDEIKLASFEQSTPVTIA
ncbi:hypothetical protein ACHAWF_015967 [Thalassiosira exigua]